MCHARRSQVRLRIYRKKAGYSQDALGAKRNVSGQMIGHIETAKRAATLEMSKDFDRIFGLDHYFEELWWHVRREQTPNWFRDYVDAESRASSIRLFGPLLISGLLQTEAYARGVQRAGQRADKLEQLVASRMARQEILCREGPPWLVFVFYEGAIRRLVGGPEVMREQYEHLLAMAKHPNISIHIVPDGASIYIPGGFTLFSFGDLPDLAYAEAVTGHGQMIGRKNQVEDLKVVFDLIRSVVVNTDDSVDLIRTAMEDLERP